MRGTDVTTNPRHLPQIAALLDQPAIAQLTAQYSHAEVVTALRADLGALRAAMRSGETRALPDFATPGFAQKLSARIEVARQPVLRPVVNATGVLIHTNLGRALLAPQALRAMADVAAHPANLELDLGTGKRGSRQEPVEGLICALTGAQAALVVNNCAAAVLLALSAMAQGREVIASRGELIEIGGAFRLPDVIAQSGAHLREVGATNKTRIRDYAAALNAHTAVLLKSHTSNYRIVGFTAAPSREELAALARDNNVILMEDLGSGILIDLAAHGLPDEPVVADILKAGVDLVMFSGDKLLGGPQCGIIAGRADLIAQLRAHPLARAVRIDKLSLAALEATLRLYQPPHDPLAEIPVLQMLSAPLAQLQRRAETLAGLLREAHINDIEITPSAARVGGGALPQQDLASVAVSITAAGSSAEALAEHLRGAPRPVIARLHKGRVMFDMRTLRDADLPDIAQAMPPR